MSTLRDVAALVGVSTATVSRVFSRPEAVLPETRERVLDAARSLAYEPHPVARSLALGRTGSLGLLVPDITNPSFASVIAAVQRHARENGFTLFVAAGDGGAEDELDLVRAIARQVDGLVLTAPRMSDDALRAVAALAPVAFINRALDDAPAVLVPSADGMVQAVDHLADAGHRSIAYLGGPPHTLTARSRLEAFTTVCARRGVETHVVGPFHQDFTAAGEKMAAELVRAGHRAVICYNDQMAVGVMRGLTQQGLRAGRDVSVIGFDDFWLTDMIDPPLTTVRMPFADAGRIATQLLLDVLEGKPEGEDATVELGTELIVRASSAAPPARPD